MHHLQHFFPNDVGGQSMCAGDATALAEDDVLPHMIQAIGWAFNAF
jgi:hypothetical protein